MASAAAASLIVADVDLDLREGEILGLAGESGCGKSTLGLTCMGFRPAGLRATGGRVLHDGVDLLSVGRVTLAKAWGLTLAHLPQNASTALNPALRIETQIDEPLRIHLGLERREREAKAVDLLRTVGLPDPEAALARYPHQFSGGQQQRIAIAIALSCDPDVLVLDEPTTGLDVTTQARINRLISGLVRDRATSTIYISHNLALLASMCDQLAIMYNGQIVERGEAARVFAAPEHPYTAALVDAIPSIRSATRPAGLPGSPPGRAEPEHCPFLDRCAFRIEGCKHPVPLRERPDGTLVRCIRSGEIKPNKGTSDNEARPRGGASVVSPSAELEVRDLHCVYSTRSGKVVAVDQVSLAAYPGRILGIAGESGSGKSTLLKCISGLQRWTSGEVLLGPEPLSPFLRRRSPEQLGRIQLVFQNPDSSLNPQHSARQILERTVKVLQPTLTAVERRSSVEEVAASVRLSESVLSRRAEELSGGQRQRIALARALVSEPDVLLCDEVTSALDVSVQATVIELLGELAVAQAKTIIFVTHDLGVLRCLSDELIVMQAGRVLERGPTDRVYETPQAEYTEALLEAVPEPIGVMPDEP